MSGDVAAASAARGGIELSIPLAGEDGTNPTDPVSVVSCLMATGSSARGSHEADNHRHGVGGVCAIASCSGYHDAAPPHYGFAFSTAQSGTPGWMPSCGIKYQTVENVSTSAATKFKIAPRFTI